LQKSPGCPGAFAPPVSPTISTRVAPNTHPPAPADQLSESPRIAPPSGLPWSIPRVAPVHLLGCGEKANFQVALNLGSLTVRRFSSSRVPPSFSSSADPYLLFRVTPLSASTAGSMMSPWLNRTLHPRRAPWMNLRLQSGHNNPDPASVTLAISTLPSKVGEPALHFQTETARVSSAGWSCCSNQL